MKVFVDETKLSDGSPVYAVRLTRFEDMPRSIDTLVIAAVSQADADQLADVIVTAINSHSTEKAIRSNG